MNFKKILVPTDFSKEANHALDIAVKIAMKSGAEIDLLHVIDVPVVGHYDSLEVMAVNDSDDPELLHPFMHHLMQHVSNKVAEIRSQYPAVRIVDHIEFDELAQQLSKFILNQETDLIVIGSKGDRGFHELFIGSNAEKIIRTAKAPVLTVKDGVDEFNLDSIVFASTFEHVSPKAIDTLKSFETFLGYPHFYFLTVVTPNTFETTPETLQRIETFALANEFKNYSSNAYNYYSEEEGIRAFSNHIGAGIIALTTHGRTGLSHLFLGSIAEEVANHAILPVLTFNEHYK